MERTPTRQTVCGTILQRWQCFIPEKVNILFFRATGALDRGSLKSRGGGKLSVNQRSVYAAKSDWCEVFAHQISNHSFSSTERPVANMNDESQCCVNLNASTFDQCSSTRWLTKILKSSRRYSSKQSKRGCWFYEQDFSWTIVHDDPWQDHSEKIRHLEVMKDPNRKDGFEGIQKLAEVTYHLYQYGIEIKDNDAESRRQWPEYYDIEVFIEKMEQWIGINCHICYVSRLRGRPEMDESGMVRSSAQRNQQENISVLPEFWRFHRLHECHPRSLWRK